MDLNYVFTKLAWMRAQQIWPNGLRYLWTDAFGLVLLTSLYAETGEQHFLDEATITTMTPLRTSWPAPRIFLVI
jgi:hypothetical protein